MQVSQQFIRPCLSSTPHHSICLFGYRNIMVDCNRSGNRICTSRICSSMSGNGSNVSISRVPHVLTIAGSDSGAGAGIQADLKACAARGAYCSTVITAITAQNSFGVQGINVVQEKFVAEQLRSVFSDMPVDVIKTGMIPSVEIVNILYQFMKDFSIQVPLVVDPVMVSTSGDLLADSSVLEEIRSKLLPLAELVTPNLKEAAALIGGGARVNSISDMRSAAKAIHHMGLCNVLVKGGDLPSSFDAVDIFYDGKDFYELQSPRIKTNNTHGTGCTLASAIAAEIAKGTPVLPAVKIAKHFVDGALNYSKDLSIGNGSQGPFDHFLQLKNSKQILSFDPGMLLLYAVTDSTINRRRDRSIEDAVRAAVEGGATIVQIREKGGEATFEFVRAARSCLEICHSKGVPLLINDRVDVAMASGADGVHVGQSDMPVAVVRSLLGPEKIIGVSCKSPENARQAWIDGADYIGCGGVYPTSTKANNPTIGIDGLKAICSNSKLPVVAIGGINASNVCDVMSMCIPTLKGVAVVSSLFDVECVLKEARNFRTVLQEAQLRNQMKAVQEG